MRLEWGFVTLIEGPEWAVHMRQPTAHLVQDCPTWHKPYGHEVFHWTTECNFVPEAFSLWQTGC